jgi:hypothetical protein
VSQVIERRLYSCAHHPLEHETGTTVAEGMNGDQPSTDAAQDWHILVTTRPTVLITGPADAVEQSLATLMPLHSVSASSSASASARWNNSANSSFSRHRWTVETQIPIASHASLMVPISTNASRNRACSSAVGALPRG